MKGVKGLSLLVIVAIIVGMTILVLVVSAIFVGYRDERMVHFSDQDALSVGCIELTQRFNCDATQMEQIKMSQYNATCGNQTGNTLVIACCRAGYTPDDCVVNVCRCAPQ
jgi:hypothetical protein